MVYNPAKSQDNTAIRFLKRDGQTADRQTDGRTDRQGRGGGALQYLQYYNQILIVVAIEIVWTYFSFARILGGSPILLTNYKYLNFSGGTSF